MSTPTPRRRGRAQRKRARLAQGKRGQRLPRSVIREHAGHSFHELFPYLPPAWMQDSVLFPVLPLRKARRRAERTRPDHPAGQGRHASALGVRCPLPRGGRLRKRADPPGRTRRQGPGEPGTWAQPPRRGCAGQPGLQLSRPWPPFPAALSGSKSFQRPPGPGLESRREE